MLRARSVRCTLNRFAINVGPLVTRQDRIVCSSREDIVLRSVGKSCSHSRSSLSMLGIGATISSSSGDASRARF
jgi:hypothetical protein